MVKFALAGLIVLIIGDSHIASKDFLLSSLQDALVSQGAIVHSYGVCGSQPHDWVAQTEMPGATWSIRQDDQVSTGRKTPGSTGVESPNNAGGVGDASGLIMLDRIVNKEVAFHESTNERAVRDSREVVELVESDKHHAGH